MTTRFILSLQKELAVTILCSLVIFILPLTSIAAPVVDQQTLINELPEISRLSAEMVRAFGGEGVVYVGIGSAPTALINFLQIQGVSAVNLPLSGLTYSGPDDDQFAENPRKKKALLDHLYHFLPRPKAGEALNLVLVDFVYTGGTLENARAWIQKYYRQPHFQGTSVQLNQVRLVGSPNQTQNVDFSESRGGKVLRLEVSKSFYELLVTDAFRPWTEFERFNVNFPFATFNRRPRENYQEMRKIFIGQSFQNRPNAIFCSQLF